MSAFKDFKDTLLMTADTRSTKQGMARPKQFSDRTTLAFPPGTFAAVAAVEAPGEDRSDFIRAAVEWEVALRSLDGYDDLKAHLLANESIADFCLKAITRALAQRKAALAGDVGETSKAPGA
jgi:hypothetical protein